ncbi:MAG: CBS domain-containing protein [Deltaproteobacteria bacterium]|nr:CBS domain-containing protein [Deltaproteobacteria bacterium]
MFEVITTHINADFDAMASMLAARKLYPDAVLVFPGSQERNLREFLLHSTYYLFEPERIRRIDLDAVERLILVDTRQRGRIGKFAAVVDRPNVDIHIYDHHPPSEDDINGSLEVVEEVGAATTIMTRLLREKGIPITPDEATVMALGIFEDTGSFSFISTREEDFEAAAYLLSQGANLNVISDMMTRELTAEQISLLNELIESATHYNIHGVDVVIAKASVNKFVGDFAVLVHKLKDMENLDVLIALARMEDRVYLVARSRIEEVNVGDVAVSFGGGGHAVAASATIRDLTLYQVEEKLLNVLREKIIPKHRAMDLMSAPVKFVAPEAALSEVEEMLNRYSVNALPVIEEEKLVGLITRVVVEKAVFHGLKDVPVREYMTREFFIVNPETPYSTVLALIVEHNQRFLPVIQGGSVVGVITRGDLLRHLQLDRSKFPEERSENDLEPRYSRPKNLSRLLEERFPRWVVQLLRRAGSLAKEMGFKVYLVGGAVRDLLLRIDNLDLDLVVEGNGIAFAQELGRREGCKVSGHIKFNTATLFLPHGVELDVATARMEYYDYPGALPKVEFGSIKRDMARRDFTMNTLALNLNPDQFGIVIDFFGGQRDIKERVIHVLHSLSFVEDPTRVFRAIRFEQRFGFKMGKHTVYLVENAVKLNFFDRLAGDRLFKELQYMLNEQHAEECVRRMAEMDVLHFIHPNISYNDSMKKLLGRVKEVLSWFDLLFLDESYERWRVYFYALVDTLDNSELEKLGQRLGIHDCKGKAFIEERGELMQAIRQIYDLDQPSNSQIQRLLRRFTLEMLLFAMARTSRKSTQMAISRFITHLRRTRTLLRGKDLIRLGLPQGPIIGKALDTLLDARLDGMVKTRSDEEALIREHFIRGLRNRKTG